METTTCLFSRARPGHSTSRIVCGFLSLPGELRNQIYGYCFESEFRCEVVAKGHVFGERKPRTVRLCSGAFQTHTPSPKCDSKAKQEGTITVRVSRPLGKYNLIKGLQTNWFTSLFAISLVCKQIHAETLPFLYKETVFVFDAPRRITNFLGVVSKPKLEHITRLQLHYSTYGCPSWTEDRIWQEKHAQSWTRTLAHASKKLTGLHDLKIWLRVNDYSPRFNLREAWVLPLLQFRRLTCASKAREESLNDNGLDRRKKSLEIVDIDFRTRVSGWQFKGNQELAKASEALHELFGQAIGCAILGAKEEEAMAAFNRAWNGKYEMWQYHLGYAKTDW